MISTSNAADLGYLALADVAAAGLDPQIYRIVGGHMVQLLIHVYRTPEATERSTADADAGIDRATAVGQNLHEHLLDSGYEATSGNRYVKKDAGGGEMAVDLLIPHGTVGEPEQLNGRGFDAIPGLGFALSATPLIVDAKVLLRNGTDLDFTVPVPDVEAALILKAPPGSPGPRRRTLRIFPRCWKSPNGTRLISLGGGSTTVCARVAVHVRMPPSPCIW